MNDEKKTGFSVELKNNRVDLWEHGGIKCKERAK